MNLQTSLPLTEVVKKINASKSILILLPAVHNVDVLASGLALYLALKENFVSNKEADQKKRINIVSSTDVTVNFQRLFAVDKISKNLGSKNLVIKLNTAHDNIEKVTSDDEDGKFNIVVTTKDGVEKLSKEEVSFGFRGVDADLLITIGINQENQIGDLLFQESDLFVGRDIIAFSATSLPLGLGNIKLNDPQASSISEIVSKLLRYMKIKISPDMATNLIAGIESATNNLVLKTNADTFAAMSWCMREGGKRNHLAGQGQNISTPSFTTGATGPVFGQPAGINSTYNPVTSPIFNQHGNQLTNQLNQNPIDQMSPQAVDKDQSSESKPNQDWFEPKIFKAGQNNS